MNKTELVAAIADKAKISKKDAEAAVKAFTEVVTKELKKGGTHASISLPLRTILWITSLNLFQLTYLLFGYA